MNCCLGYDFSRSRASRCFRGGIGEFSVIASEIR
jgi:hypothetical protein